MKIILLGYGKMGKTIERLAIDAGHTIVDRITSANRNTLTLQQLRAADVVIEFTQPESAVSNIRACFEAGVPVVTGTTGWHAQLAEITAECEKWKGSLLYSSNFSIGVNLFFAFNEQLAQVMKNYAVYQPRIEETHHTQKKDAPSGTALSLKACIQPAYPNTPIPIIDHRIDPVVGTHTVYYQSAIDTLSFTHEAHSRDGFAQGALTAAAWLCDKKGVFTFRAMLGV